MLTDMKGEIDNNSIIVGDFSIPLSAMDRASRQKNQQGNNGLESIIRLEPIIRNIRANRPNRHL